MKLLQKNFDGLSLLHTLPLVIICVLFFQMVAVAVVVAVAHCNQNTPPVIFNFGDSNSDTSGLSDALGLGYGYPYGRALSGEVEERCSDGRLVIDFLCEYLGTKYLNPYLNSINPDFKNGVNFAIRGSAALPKNVKFNLDVRNLNVQIQQFMRFYNRSIALHSRGVSKLVGEEGFKNALYTIDIGQNDLFGSFGELSYAQAIQKIPSIISAIKDAMWAMYEHGGRNFWVHNTGPLGCLPRELAIWSNNVRESDDYDEYGCLKALNEGAKVFNDELNALCQQLTSQMKNATIVYVDVYSIKYDLIANCSSYGFENPLMACCGSGGPPYNYKEDTMCPDCNANDCTVCKGDRPYINFDGVHYTEAANSIIASKIFSGNYSSPPIPFSFFCDDLITPFPTQPNFID